MRPVCLSTAAWHAASDAGSNFTVADVGLYSQWHEEPADTSSPISKVPALKVRSAIVTIHRYLEVCVLASQSCDRLRQVPNVEWSI